MVPVDQHFDPSQHAILLVCLLCRILLLFHCKMAAGATACIQVVPGITKAPDVDKASFFSQDVVSCPSCVAKLPLLLQET